MQPQPATFRLALGLLLRLLLLQEGRAKAEREKADMSFALQRSGTDKEHEVVAAKAAASIAEGKLQSLLEELSNAKHTSEAASTTSGFVLKVCVCVGGGVQRKHVQPWAAAGV